MSQVKFVEVLRCNSEDPNYPSRNLLNSGKWLCHKNNPHQSAEVEISFSRATNINFIDIGNSGSCYVDILVRHSLKGNDFKSLIPTFTFMSVPESKQGEKKCKVEMFKKDSMMADVRDEKWDVLKIVCRQPYKQNSQYGISFINVKGLSSENNQVKDTKIKSSQPSNQSALNTFFGFNNTSLVSPKPGKSLSLKSKSPLIKSPHQTIITKVKASNGNGLQKSSPRNELSAEEEMKFMIDVEQFLYKVGFDKDIKSGKQIVIAEYREKIEKEKGEKLTKQEKKVLMLVASEIKKSCQAERDLAKVTSTPPNVNSFERKCSKCEVSFSNEVMEIHEQICTATPRIKPRQNRKSVCFDHSTSDEDQKQSIHSFSRRIPSMSTKTLTSAGETSASSASSSPESRWLGKETPKSSGSTSTVTLKSSAKHFIARKRSGSTSKSALVRLPRPIDGPIINTHPPSSDVSTSSVMETSRDSPVSKKLFLDKNENITNKRDDFFDSMNLSDFDDGCGDDDVVIKDDHFQDFHNNSITINDDDDDVVICKQKNFKDNRQYVECPMCFELISQNIIEAHASTCNGKTETVSTLHYEPHSPKLPTSASKQTSSNVHTFSPNLSTAGDDSRENDKGSQGDTQECPVCHSQINKYKIALHVVLCNGKSLREEDQDEDDLPTIFNQKSRNSAKNSRKPHNRARNINTSASNTPLRAHNVPISASNMNTSASNTPLGARNVPISASNITVPDHDYHEEREETTCPICSASVDKSMIEVHVNMCLDRLQ